MLLKSSWSESIKALFRRQASVSPRSAKRYRFIPSLERLEDRVNLAPGDGSAFGLQVSVTLLGGAPINVGPLAASNTAGPTTATVASATVPGVITTGVISSSATLNATTGEVDASATDNNVGVPLLAALGAVSATSIKAQVQATSSGETGTTTLTDATLGSLGALATNPAKNTVIQINIAGINVATLTLNEQIPNADGSLTVNAFHLHLLGGAVGALGTGDVIIGSATGGPAANPAPSSPTLGTLSPTQWTVGQSGYTGEIPITGGTGPYTVSAQSGLPPGLTAAISGNDVVFNGIPTTAGAYSNAQITVEDKNNQTGGGTYTVTINSAPTLGSLTQSQWTVDQSGFTGEIPITDGTGPYTVSAQSGLPPGLTAAISGNDVVFHGAPTQGGTYSDASLTIKDAAGATVGNTYSMTILTPDLKVVKTADNSTVNGGDSVGYTVTISNIGNGQATGVGLTDPLPAGVTWTIDTTTGNPANFTISSGSLALSSSFLSGGDSLAAGQSIAVHITGTAPLASTTLTNTATVSGTNEPSDVLANDTSTATITVQEPDLKVVKTADSGTVNAGDGVGYTVTISNIGTSQATGVSLSDTLPAGVTWSIDNGTGEPSDFTISSGSLALSSSFISGGDTLAAGQSISVHITGTAPLANTTLSNTATVSATNEPSDLLGNDSSTATITVQAPDLKVVKTADNSTVNAGASVGYTVTISNIGTGQANGVSLSDTLPAGVTWNIDNGTGNPADFTISSGALALSSSFISGGDSLAAGASISVHITSTAPLANTTLSNTATVSGTNEPSNVLGNDSSTATITVQAPDLKVVKTADNSTVNAGDGVGYTVTVSNIGTGQANGVSLSDALPAGMTWNIDTSTGNPADFTISSGALALSSTYISGGDSLAAGQSIAVHITGTAPLAGTTLSNTATVSATNEPSNVLANDSSTATITVLAPDLKVVKTADNSTVKGGDSIGYTVTISNIGTGQATGVGLSDTLPAGVTWSIDTGTDNPADFSISSGALALSSSFISGGDSLAAGASIAVHITSTAPLANTTLTNTATVSATNEPSSVLGNNTSTATITVEATPTVTIPSSSEVTATTAILGGDVTNQGGAAVTTRGVVYSLNMSLSGGTVVNAASGGTGVFTTNVTGLNPDTIYYFAAFATNSAGTAYSPVASFRTEVGSFGPWNSLGGGAQQLTTATDTNGDLELFGIGLPTQPSLPGGPLLVNTQFSPNGPYNGWTSLGGYVTQIAVGTEQNGTLVVFGVGGDHAAWFRERSTTGPSLWTPWQSLGGYVKQLAVGTDHAGNLELFGIGGDNAVWLNVETANNAGTFGGWNSLGGYVTQITVASNQNSTLTVFGIGGDHAAWFRQQKSTTDLSFTTWASLGGYVQQLTAGLDAQGNLELFGIGGDNAAWVTIQGGPNTFTYGHWNSLGGYVTQLAVGENSDGTLELAGIGGDHTAWVKKQTSPAGPAFDAFWTSLGGYVKQLALGTNQDLALSLIGIGGDNAAWISTEG